MGVAGILDFTRFFKVTGGRSAGGGGGKREQAALADILLLVTMRKRALAPALRRLAAVGNSSAAACMAIWPRRLADSKSWLGPMLPLRSPWQVNSESVAKTQARHDLKNP